MSMRFPDLVAIAKALLHKRQLAALLKAPPPPPAYTCGRCGKQSWNSEDGKYRYCGACHRYDDE